MARIDQKQDSHIAEIHHAESLVDEIEQTRERLRGVARKELGVTGEKGAAPPLRETLSKHSLGAYPLFAICLLGMVDTFAGSGLGILAPEIAATMGLSAGGYAQVFIISVIAGVFAPITVARLVQSRPRRALLSLVMAVGWTFATISLGFVVSIAGLALVLSLNAFTTSSVAGLHIPLLMDTYPPEVRVRGVAYYQSTDFAGAMLAPLSIALLAGVLGYTWRGVFVATGIFTACCVLLCLRLRDPGFGRWDTQRIRATAREEQASPADGSMDVVELGFLETLRRLFLIPAVRRILIAFIFYGMALLPYITFTFFFLQQRWGMGPGARAVLAAVASGASALAIALYAKRGDDLYREDPKKALQLPAMCMFGLGVLNLATVLAPWFWLMIALSAATWAVRAPIAALLYPTILSVIPASARSHLGALVGIFGTVFGGLLGATLLGGIETRYGITVAMMSLFVPWTIATLLIFSAGKLVAGDLDRMIDDVLEDEEIKRITAAGEKLPMLSCRHVDFSYGQIQVLFGVDFTVDDGEMVALLGTNGAGKSTLLKVISGIGLPTRGSVRFRGADITFLDAERRVGLGITQIPGGRAVFKPLSVVDNLRSFAYTLGRDSRSIDAAIERCFDVFPRLAERRNQKAVTLSGGEQQMLGLSKAFILEPRLLLIDELSLGLAPVIVGQLLEMVKTINAEGTAVVLVEQSVNIALSVVDHAYFMEKGEIRFDGSSDDLLAREDLLRAVFLEGVKSAL